MKRVALAALLLAGCTPKPTEIIAAANAAFEKGDKSALISRVHRNYQDALGDRAQLDAGAAALFERFAVRKVEVVESVEVPGQPVVEGYWQLELAGEHTMKLSGPFRVEFERDGVPLLIRSGYLDDLRDVVELVDRRRAALEANDPDAYGDLLHPMYKDGDLDRAQVLDRLREDIVGIPIRHEPIHYQVEVRRDLAHVDERFRLRIGETLHPSSLARLTLTRSVGRWQFSAGLYPQQKPPKDAGSP